MGTTDTATRLVVYGHRYCMQARLLADTLAEERIDHEWRDVRDGDPKYRDELRKLARGYLSVPTVIFPDGTVLVEPMPDAVLQKLRPSQPDRFNHIVDKFFGLLHKEQPDE